MTNDRFTLMAQMVIVFVVFAMADFSALAEPNHGSSDSRFSQRSDNQKSHKERREENKTAPSNKSYQQPKSHEGYRPGYKPPARQHVDRDRRQPPAAPPRQDSHRSRPVNSRDHRPTAPRQDERHTSPRLGIPRGEIPAPGTPQPSHPRKDERRTSPRVGIPPGEIPPPGVPRLIERPRSDHDGRKDERRDNRHDGRRDDRSHEPRDGRRDDRRYDDRRYDERHFKHRPQLPRYDYRHGHRPNYRLYKRHRYIYYHTPWYNTWFLAPLYIHFYDIGVRLTVLPSPYIRIVVSGVPYFYASGVYYRQYGSGYIVVSAPIGAFVQTLPPGFIAFSIGVTTYYYVNDTYYVWDDIRDGFVVAAKPYGADEAMAEATQSRLYVYPNAGQSEEQQAKDRYECHLWAVSESGIDPTSEETQYTDREQDDYKRAITACLEAKDYTVE